MSSLLRDIMTSCIQFIYTHIRRLKRIVSALNWQKNSTLIRTLYIQTICLFACKIQHIAGPQDKKLIDHCGLCRSLMVVQSRSIAGSWPIYRFFYLFLSFVDAGYFKLKCASLIVWYTVCIRQTRPPNIWTLLVIESWCFAAMLLQPVTSINVEKYRS